jgi:hypothetical protein
MNVVARTTQPIGRDVQGHRVICTLGMHRSGTSLVSRMLNLLGVHLGTPRSISGRGDDNPKGHWEHQRLSHLNDEILARFGGRWDEPPVFPADWPRDPALEDIRQQARAILAADFAAQPLWGWKDPRTCLTIPFWQDLIGPIRYVLCVRNPSAVVASLSRRNAMRPEQAERLWLTHVHASLIHTSGRPRIVVFYEDILADWARDLRQLAAFIGRPEGGDDPQVQASVGEFVEKELCHHRESLEDLAGSRQISFSTKGLYLALRGQAPSDAGTNGELEMDPAADSRQIALDLLATDALETWDRSAAVTAERDAMGCRLQAQAATIAALDAERIRNAADAAALSDHVVYLSERCQRLAVQERQVMLSMTDLESALHQVSLELDTRTRERDDRTRERDDRTRERDDQLRERIAAVEALREIDTSRAWTLVTFCRHLIVTFLPAATRRRRLFNAIIGRLTRRVQSGRYHS